MPMNRRFREITTPHIGLVRIGLRGRLLLGMIPFFLVAFLVAWWISSNTARDGLSALSKRNLKATAQSLSVSIRDLIEDTRADLLAVSRMDLPAQVLDNGDPKNFAWFVDELILTKERYTAIIVSDLQGTVVGSNTQRRDKKPLNASIQGQSVANENWFKKLLKNPVGHIWLPASRPAYLSGALIPNETVFGFAYPVFDVVNDHIGTVAIFCSLEFINERLAAHLNTSRGDIIDLFLLTDAAGTPLAWPTGLAPQSPWKTRKLLPESPTGQRSLWYDKEGMPYKGVSVAVDGLVSEQGWQIVGLIQKKALEKPVRTIRRTLLAIFVVALILSTIVLYSLSTHIVNPLRQLTRKATTTSRASDFTPIINNRRDEVGILGETYNRMMETLQGYETDLESKVTLRTQELEAKKNDLQNMLENMRAGIFTIDHNLTIHHEYSKYLEKIFHTQDITGRNAISFLFGDGAAGSDFIRLTQNVLEDTIGEDVMNFDINEHNLVTQVTRDIRGSKRLLEISWNPIIDVHDIIEKYLVNVRDVTDLKTLEDEADQQRKQFQIVAQILASGPESIKRFLAHSDRLLQSCAWITRQDTPTQRHIDEAMRSIHTIKGNSRTIGFSFLQNATHQLEGSVCKLRAGKASAALAHAGRKLADVIHLCSAYQEIFEVDLAAIAQEINPQPDSSLEHQISQLKNIVSTLKAKTKDKDTLTTLGHIATQLENPESIPFNSVIQPIVRSLPGLAEQISCPAPQAEVSGGGLPIPAHLIEPIQDIVTHLVRNTLAHAIFEGGDAKLARIQMQAVIEHNMLKVSYQDTGRGLDLERIRHRIRELHIDPSATIATDQDLAEILFRPGFSTKSQADTLSGRGVGMDAIRSLAIEAGGEATIELLESVGSPSSYRPFRIMLRLTLTLQHA
jgi:two-component system, chemotaxis family, sensor kinase CheA